jgi:hypothetical protein
MAFKECATLPDPQIDHVIRNHAAYNESLDAARHRGQSLPEFLNGQVLRLAEERGLGHYGMNGFINSQRRVLSTLCMCYFDCHSDTVLGF